MKTPSPRKSRPESKIRVRRTPFTAKEAHDYWRRNPGARGTLSGVVAVDLDELIERDIEGFNDLVSERLVGSVLLMDIGYKAVGVRKGEVLIQITGDASEVFPLDEEGEEGSGAAASDALVAQVVARVREVAILPDSALDEAVQDAHGASAASKNNQEDGRRDDENHDAASRTASAINNDGLDAQVRYLLSQGYSMDRIIRIAEGS